MVSVAKHFGHRLVDTRSHILESIDHERIISTKRIMWFFLACIQLHQRASWAQHQQLDEAEPCRTDARAMDLFESKSHLDFSQSSAL